MKKISKNHSMSSLVLIAAATTLLNLSSCQQPIPTSQASIKETRMTQNPQAVPFKINAKLLEVYEDLTEPPGSRQGANRPVGHAVVRLRIENLTPSNLDFSITKIDILSENGNQSLMSKEGGKINLGGLQILEPGFHLTNKQGFKGAKQVKAVLTYQFKGKNYTTESSKFNVVVNP
jgi:hypothetical protein